MVVPLTALLTKAAAFILVTLWVERGTRRRRERLAREGGS